MTRVLIIDDSKSAIEKASGVLRAAGHTVEVLELLIHLPELVKSAPPDVILLDLSMPLLPGVGVAKLIRRFQEAPIPIVLYSSKPIEELRRSAREIGAVAFVQKGASDRQLIDAVSGAVAGQPIGAQKAAP